MTTSQFALGLAEEGPNGVTGYGMSIEKKRPDLTGSMLHLPPGQWWSPDGWLHMEIEEVAPDEYRDLPDGWVWVCGHLYVDGVPVDRCRVPVRKEALATPDARESTQLLRDHATRWLVQYLTSVGGKARVTDIKQAAETAGFTYGTLRRVSAADIRISRGDGHWRFNGESE
jgi:hypothetical protein